MTSGLLAVLGVFVLALGFFWPRVLHLGTLLYLGAALADALAKGVCSGPAQPALLLGGFLALRGESFLLRPWMAPLRRYLLLLALLLGLFALKALSHPGGAHPLSLSLLHGGAFLVAYLALAVGVGAGVMGALQDLRLRRSPEKAVRSAPLWSLRRLELGYLRVGYLAATLGLGSGMAWAWGYFGSPLALDPKELSAFLGWFSLNFYFLWRNGLEGFPGPGSFFSPTPCSSSPFWGRPSWGLGIPRGSPFK